MTLDSAELGYMGTCLKRGYYREVLSISMTCDASSRGEKCIYSTKLSDGKEIQGCIREVDLSSEINGKNVIRSLINLLQEHLIIIRTANTGDYTEKDTNYLRGSIAALKMMIKSIERVEIEVS